MPCKFTKESNNPLFKNSLILKSFGTFSIIDLFNFTKGSNLTAVSSLLISGIVIDGRYFILWYPGILVLIVIFNSFGTIIFLYSFDIIGILILLIYYYYIIIQQL